MRPFMMAMMLACGGSTHGTGTPPVEASTALPGSSTMPPGTATAPPATTTAPSDSTMYAGSFGATSGTYTLQGDRKVLVHLPPMLSAKPALVIALHGTGANADVLSALQELDILSVSDANGFIVAAPASTDEGGSNADHSDGGVGWKFDGTADSNADLVLVRAIISEAVRAYGVDAARVYVVGHSNGALFAYFVAAQLGDRIAAFAETSGGLIACGARTDCEHRAAGATSCADVLSSAPSACKCEVGAGSFPGQKPTGRMPPGFLKHNADDDTVSPVYTCRLADYLGPSSQVSIDGDGGHAPTNSFMTKAWAFLATQRLN